MTIDQQFDKLNSQIDAIQDKYAPKTPERGAILSLNGLLLGIVKFPDRRPALVQQTKDLIRTHVHHPELHHDLLTIADLFLEVVTLAHEANKAERASK